MRGLFRGQVRHRPGCGGGATRQRQQTGGPSTGATAAIVKFQGMSACVISLAAAGTVLPTRSDRSIENAPAFSVLIIRFK